MAGLPRIPSKTPTNSFRWCLRILSGSLDPDLTARMHSAVPLFTGVIPPTGNLTDHVCAAIDSLLKEKGVPATAIAMSVSATGQLKEMRFRMSGLNVQIAEIRFPGATADHITALQAETKNLIGSAFIQSSTA